MGLRLPFFFCFVPIVLIALMSFGLKPSLIKIMVAGGITTVAYIVLMIFQNVKQPSISLPDELINT
ncbi:hypothetical protein [Tissierella sp.]|uniref:hypothetical protein n=1 Tax=Tissierella sp. TaxID=41274 RepID=UPI0030DCDC7A